MQPRVKSSLLWGVIGALTFLVLLQGYRLVGGTRLGLSLPAAFGVAVGVGIVAMGAVYLVEGRLD